MKKLTAKEILSIVEKNYTVENFGFNELTETEVELTEEQYKKAEDLQKARDEYWEKIKDNFENISWKAQQLHPDYIKLSAMPRRIEVIRDMTTLKLGLGKVVEIEQVGGEDEGSHWHSVKHFVEHDVYIKTIGYYQSYSGTEFYSGFGKEVFPTEKTITVYE